MTNKLFYISIFAVLSLLHSQNILCQSVKEKLILSDSLFYDFQTGSGVEPLFIEQMWKNSLGEVDSVLWKTSIQPDLSIFKNFKLKQVDTSYFTKQDRFYYLKLHFKIRHPSLYFSI